MAVTDEVKWSVFDFFFASILIGGVGLGWEMILKMTCHRLWRMVLVLTLFGTFLLI